MSHFWGPPSVPDQAVNVVLGPPLTGGDLKHVGSAEKQLLGVSVCHHLPGSQKKGFMFGRERRGRNHTVPSLSHQGIPRKGVPIMSRFSGKGDAQHVRFPI